MFRHQRWNYVHAIRRDLLNSHALTTSTIYNDANFDIDVVIGPSLQCLQLVYQYICD